MRRVWFHVSEIYLGNAFLFVPRVPKGIDVDEDSTIPRICVADSIEHCIMGMFGEPDPVSVFNHSTQLWVYELRGKVKRPTLNEVPDRYRTNEHWFITPTIGILNKTLWWT